MYSPKHLSVLMPQICLLCPSNVIPVPVRTGVLSGLACVLCGGRALLPHGQAMHHGGYDGNDRV